jgi:hypothetical protein
MCSSCNPSNAQKKGSGRRRLWQVPACYHCSLIGTCLSIDELRTLTRKAELRFDAPVNDHTLHVALVHSVDDRNRTGRLVQRYLDNKFAAEVRRFARLVTSEELEEAWRRSARDGDLAGAYWALMTHPRTTEGVAERAYGEVHMLSHVGATALAETRAALRIARQECAEASRAAGAARASLTEATARTRALESRISELELEQQGWQLARRRLAVLEERVARSAEAAERDHLRSELADAAYQLRVTKARAWQLETRATLAEREVARLSAALEQASAEQSALEATLSTLLPQGSQGCDACPRDGAANCPLFDLGGRCIAYVGGRNRLTPQLRAITERHNGRFVHHDGGLQEAAARLEAILEQADVVLCPLDCVSHGACERLKKHCKQRGKPCVFLRTASLSAFAAGLRSAANA